MTNIRFSCALENLYDFNYEDSINASYLAEMQLGYGKGVPINNRNHGKVFRHRINIVHDYNNPFDLINVIYPNP